MIAGLDIHVYFSLFLYLIPLRNNFDHVYTVSELDLDCLPMLNISQPNARLDDFNFMQYGR